MLHALILHLYFFKCFAFFKFITPSQESDMNKSFSIIFLKVIIIIIKVDFINIYYKNIHFISKKCDFTKIFIKKSISLLAKNFPCEKPIRKSFDIAQKSSTVSLHICEVLYSSVQYFSRKGSSETILSNIYWILNQSSTEPNTKKPKKTSINRFITHFLSLVFFRNKSYCRRIRTDRFHYI